MADKQDNLNNQLKETEKIINNVNKGLDELNKKLKDMSPSSTKSKSKSNMSFQDAADMMDDLIKEKIQEKGEQLDKSYEEAIKKNPKNKKILGTKQRFIDRNLLSYGNSLNMFASNIYNKESAYNTKYGGNFNRNDVYSMVSQAATKADSNVTAAINKEMDAANTMSSAGKVFMKAARVIWDAAWSLVRGGIERQVNTYESTFSNFASRTNTGSGTYLKQQMGTASSLFWSNLNDNVGISEVMQMWNSLANTGMSSENIFANALDNVITQKIVPYLDVTSKDINILNDRLNGNFIKDIRGINKANLEIAGNNYVTKELLDKIIEQVQPMSDEAIQNLTEGSAEFTSLINYLTPTIGESAAKEYANMLFKAQNYGGQMLQSGTTFEKLFTIDSMKWDINNPNDWNDIVANAGVGNSQLLAGLLPGYNGTYSSYLSQIGGASLGISDAINRAANKMTAAGYTPQNLTNLTNNNGRYQGYVDAVNQDFNNGIYQTATEKQKNLTENMSNKVAAIEEQIGVFGTKIVEGIGGILLALVGGKVGAAIAGAFGLKAGASGAGGLGSLIAHGGGLELGSVASNLISVTAPTAITLGVGKAFSDVQNGIWDKEESKSAEQWSLDNYGNDLSNNKLYAQIQGKKAELGKNKGGLVFNGIGSLFSSIGVIFGDDKAKADQLRYRLNAQKILEGNRVDDNSLEDIYLAYYIGADRAGKLGSMGYTSEQIKEILNSKGISTHEDLVSFLQNNLSKIQQYLPTTENGGKVTVTNVTNDAWLKDHYFRQGLGRVPYDNFPALLHEGEAILTASTTNSLNELVQEYKNNKSSTAELDVIIQNQTNQLLEKMNEIISTINVTSGPIGFVNESQRKIKNSMTSLTSTLAFQN